MADPDQGAAFLNQGISQGLQDYGKIYANGKIADSFVKTNPELLEQWGMSPEQFGAMSAQDKTSAITGYYQAQGAARQAALTRAQIAEYGARANEYSSIADWRKAQADRQTQQDTEESATGDFLRNVYSAPPTAGAAPGAPGNGTMPNIGSDQMSQMMAYGGDPDALATMGARVQDPSARIAYALQNTPGLGGRSFLNAYKTLMQYGGPDGSGQDNAPRFTTGPDGTQWAYNAKTGTFQASPAATPLTDADGNVVPGAFVGRSGVKFAPTARTPDASLVDSREQSALTQWHKRLDPVQTQLEYAQDKIADGKTSDAERTKYNAMIPTLAKQRDQILSERPAVGATAAAPNAAPAIPSPKSQAEFDALPSGSKFVNPADGRILTKK